MKKLTFVFILLAICSAHAQTDDKQILKQLNENVVSLYKDQKIDEAVKLARQAVDLSIKIYGAEHSETAIAYSNLGVLYRDKKKFKESTENLAKTVEIYEKIPGLPAAELMAAYETLAFSQSLEGNKEAEASFLKAIEIGERKFGKESRQIFSPTFNLANFYARGNESEKADELYLKSYRLAIKYFGRESEQLTQIEDSRSCLTGSSFNIERNRVFNEERLKLLGGLIAKNNSGVINSGIINGKAKFLPKPKYPAEARSQRAGGTISVRVWIDEQGNVTQAKAICGHPILAKSSEDSARGSKFAPTLLNGEAVKTVGILIYNFVP